MLEYVFREDGIVARKLVSTVTCSNMMLAGFLPGIGAL